MPKAKVKTKGRVAAAPIPAAAAAAPIPDPAAAAPIPDPTAAAAPIPAAAAENMILSDEDALLTIRQGSKERYRKSWQDFKTFFPSVNFDVGRPAESQLIEYFTDLKTRGWAPTTCWTNFSMINSMIKNKYSFDVRNLPRVITLLKSFEGPPKKKAAIFSADDLRAFCEAPELTGAYWDVRRAVVILAYFGGLRLIEAMELEIEKIEATPRGYKVTHSRAKQRSDKRHTSFLVPKVGLGEGESDFDWAGCLGQYLDTVKNKLGKYTGRVFYTGRKNGNIINQVLGRNMMAEIPHQIAEFLGKDQPQLFTFHSFRRSSATAAADQGATAQQMVDFYGWKSTNMTAEYISTSRHQLGMMANKLGITEPADVQRVPGTEGMISAERTDERADERADEKADERADERAEKNKEADDFLQDSSDDEPLPKKRKGDKKVIIINM